MFNFFVHLVILQSTYNTKTPHGLNYTISIITTTEPCAYWAVTTSRMSRFVQLTFCEKVVLTRNHFSFSWAILSGIVFIKGRLNWQPISRFHLISVLNLAQKQEAPWHKCTALSVLSELRHLSILTTTS